jgi:phosphoserine phosphatase
MAAEIPVTSLTAQEFVEVVVRLRPRVAAFDCDGTLWSGDAGEGFFQWEMEQGLVSPEISRAMRARYAEYKGGKVSEEQMCGEMVTMHRGMAESALLDAAMNYFENSFPNEIFPEMRDLVLQLQSDGCDVWAVSSSNEWMIRAGMKHFNIAKERILAASVEIENGIITDRIVQVPSGPGKPEALRKVVKGGIDAAFGNSRWDADMLAMAQNAFAVNPRPDLETMARERSWTVYYPQGASR